MRCGESEAAEASDATAAIDSAAMRMIRFERGRYRALGHAISVAPPAAFGNDVNLALF